MAILAKFQNRLFGLIAVLLVLFTSACQVEISIGKPTTIQKEALSPTATLQRIIAQSSQIPLPFPTNQLSPTMSAQRALYNPRPLSLPSPTNQPSPTDVNKVRVSPTPSPTAPPSINSTVTVTTSARTISPLSPPLLSTPISIIPAHSPPEHILAPNIGLDAAVTRTKWTVIEREGQQTSTWIIPDDAAGWHENSNLPGHGSNIVLSGHHNIGAEVFRNLIDLEKGNEIILIADGHDYHYIVTDRFILPERNVSEEQRKQNAQWIMPTLDERVTLVTCWPYNDNTHRLIVIAIPTTIGYKMS
ncbi:MAG: sortase [Anaerolineae bacterium]|nr:sortase [Anaerolineae bacterium]